MNERLSKEQRDSVMRSFIENREQGYSMPRLHDSLLGLDPSTYKGISFPGGADQTSLIPPSELVSFAYNGTDAYAVALLATDTLLFPGCTMTVSCQYRKGAQGSLGLEFSSRTSALIPELWGDRMAVFLTIFPRALEVKGIPVESAIFCNKVGAPAWFSNPGGLIYEKSILAKLPPENWPVAKRQFEVTDELRAKAKHTAYLLTAPSSEFSQD